MITAQNTFTYCDVTGFHCANADFSAKDHLAPSLSVVLGIHLFHPA
jgi:hypothetical protein